MWLIWFRSLLLNEEIDLFFMKFCELNVEFVGKKKLKVKIFNLIFSKMELFFLCYRNVKLIKGWFFILNIIVVSFNYNENFDYFEFLYEFSNIF